MGPLEEKQNLMVYQKYAFFPKNCKFDQAQRYKLKMKDQKQRFYLMVCRRFKAKYDLQH